MKLRLSSLLATALLSCVFSFGQSGKNRITIIADISTYPGTLPVSNRVEWQGDDTLVPMSLPDPDKSYRASGDNIMGAEYLMIRYYPTPIDPRGDSSKSFGSRKIKRYKAKTDSKYYSWSFESGEPMEVTNEALLGGSLRVSPGDSIYVTYDNDKNYIISGHGTAKYEVFYAVKKIVKEKAPVLTRDAENRYYINIPQFLALDSFYNKQINSIIRLVENNKGRLSRRDMEWLKAWGISYVEETRLMVFGLIPIDKDAIEMKKFTHTANDVARLWDRTMYKKWGLWARSNAVQRLQGIESRSYITGFIINELYQKSNYRGTNISQTSFGSAKKSIYEKLKKDYDGFFRDRIISEYIREDIVQEMGTSCWFAQSILNDFYSFATSPGYVSWMKWWAKKNPGCNTDAPNFSLKDEQGKEFSYNKIYGRFAVINFWSSGKEECKAMAPVITALQDRYKNDPDIVFLNVSVDKDKKLWQKGIKEGVYFPKGGIHLYTGGSGLDHEMVRDFNIVEFPTTRFIDMFYWVTVDKNHPEKTKFSENEINEMIVKAKERFKKEARYSFKDGPYVFNEDGRSNVYFINSLNVSKQPYNGTLIVSTDEPEKKMNVSIQKQLNIQPSEYTADKMLVLSDIEGNFSAFRKLLQANKVIDSDFNWTFGEGHLVFAGDMFDRGEQVTECLWMIYSLEEKAKAKGGYVHFILGNHEIMNLNGENSYVKAKYIRNSSLMGKTVAEVYNENSELGRWLRTKNVIEKIGDNLFCHGGISPSVNALSLTIEQMNMTARPFYARSSMAGSTQADPVVNVLYHAYKSPFWYRQYYEDHFSKTYGQMFNKASEKQIDSTCQKFNVRRIVTGHTIIADTISVHYGGKVINTDTRHAAGKSEALLIEGDKFYRVNDKGERYLLFIDDKRRSM